LEDLASDPIGSRLASLLLSTRLNHWAAAARKKSCGVKLLQPAHCLPVVFQPGHSPGAADGEQAEAEEVGGADIDSRSASKPSRRLLLAVVLDFPFLGQDLGL
jgi:hypothetical protein